MATKNRAASSVDTADETVNESTVEVSQRPRDVVAVGSAVRFDEETLRNLTNFEDALRLAQEEFGNVDEAGKVLGDGFALLKDDGKARLVGVPVLLLNWDFYDGDFGSRFVAVRLVTHNPDGSINKYIVNDGSTGIADTLARYTERTGRNGGLFVRNGFRPSEYQYCEICGTAVDAGADDDHKRAGKHRRATTYYLDTSL